MEEKTPVGKEEGKEEEYGEGATPKSPIKSLIAKIERREEIHTDASTRWYVYFGGVYYDIATAEKIGLVRRVYLTHSKDKTRWNEYLEVLNKFIRLCRKRVSYRGYADVQCFKPRDLKASKKEIEVIRLARA
jgi:hypothetical protein